MITCVLWHQELRSSLAAERLEREQAAADLSQERQTHAQALREREDAWAAEGQKVKISSTQHEAKRNKIPFWASGVGDSNAWLPCAIG